MTRFASNFVVFAICMLSHCWLRAGSESARIFPVALDVWLQVPDVKTTKETMFGGVVGSVFEKISKSPQWSAVVKNLRINNSSSMDTTGFTITELAESVESMDGEFAFGLFTEQGDNKWCLFLEPKSEYVAIEILRSNLEKRFEKQGFHRVETRIGDCYLYTWSRGDNCLVAYTIRDEKLLASNSPNQLMEMATRWVQGGADGLASDREFASASKSLSSREKSCVNLFFRNQGLILCRSEDSMKKRFTAEPTMMAQMTWIWFDILNSLDTYRLLPFFQSDVTSTFASLQFPDRSKGVELALRVQVNTPVGDKLFERPAKAVFPEDGPFGAFDVVSYSALHADFWTASDYLRFKQSDPSILKAKEEARELARKHGLKLDSLSKDSQHLHPIAYRCLLADGSSAMIFRFRNLEKSSDVYSKRRFSSLEGYRSFGNFISTTSRKTSDGIYHVENMTIPFNLPESLASSKTTASPRVYGVRGEYFIISNSERFFTELPVKPEDSLSESIGYRMVKQKLDQQFPGNTFALDYWDFSHLIEESGQRFEDSNFSGTLRVLGATSFNDLFRSIAEDLGPVGGAVSKNDDGFRLDYLMLTRR
ncbi:MAG: hypothetical protein ACK5OC_03895 [Pirellula sp.]|jgi:hypothetical protein